MTNQRPVHGLFLFLTCLILAAPVAQAQSRRPVPHPIIPPPAYDLAVAQGTRTADGAPGSSYWQNTASYDIDVTLSPPSRMVRASALIRYFNNSPDQPDRIYLHLRQNLHREDARRNRTVSITGGVSLGPISLDGDPLIEHPYPGRAGYHVDGTILRVELPEPLSTGDSLSLSIAWSFEVPGSAPRMGQDGQVFFLGFWYPQMAVYDDVMGWTIDQYMGMGEFYMGYADYDVRITVPQGYLVAATGELQNSEDVLAPRTLQRLAAVETADSIVHVVEAPDRVSATVESESGTLTWHFTAPHVRDFAFAASADYVWDAGIAEGGDGRKIPVHALYRPGTSAWDEAAEFVRWSVEWLSDRLVPYPFSHMTSVEGIISGGMEYPMLTLIGGPRIPPSLFRTTFHEVAHIWYPMLVGQNEKAFAWMDEGLVSLLSDESQEEYWNEDDAHYYRYYARVAATGQEVESMRHTDEYPLAGSARTAALYGKPTVAFQALRGMVGAEAFDEALRTYTRLWSYRHPYPWDFFRAMNNALGRDLDWFWSAFLYETWTLDHAVASVSSLDSGVEVVIEDRDLLPMPTVVQVEYAGGSTERQVIPVEHWLSGERSATLTFPAGDVVRVELDPDRTNPDLIRENDVWEPQR